MKCYASLLNNNFFLLEFNLKKKINKFSEAPLFHHLKIHLNGSAAIKALFLEIDN